MAKVPKHLPPLDLLAAFEAAGRHLSFTRAASERFVTQSAVSRQIKALEDDLGVSLFRRKHRALELTDDGLALLQSCSAALDGLRATVARLRAPTRPHAVTVTTTPGFASLWLIPRLASFTAAHPGVNVHIDATFARRDLDVDAIDVAVRYGRSDQSEGVRLFGEEIMPVCSRRLLADGRRPLRAPEDLRHHTLLALADPARRTPMADWDLWFDAVGLRSLEPAATLAFSDYDDVIRAAMDGQGVALGRRPLIDGLLKARRLVAPLRGAWTSPRAFFLLVARRSSADPGVQAFSEWLLAEANASRDAGSVRELGATRGRGQRPRKQTPSPLSRSRKHERSPS